jgi:hypothetical protein
VEPRRASGDAEGLAACIVDYLRRRRRLVVRLARVDASLRTWVAWETEPGWAKLARVPPAEGVSSAGLRELRRLLVEELDRLDGRQPAA